MIVAPISQSQNLETAHSLEDLLDSQHEPSFAQWPTAHRLLEMGRGLSNPRLQAKGLWSLLNALAQPPQAADTELPTARRSRLYLEAFHDGLVIRDLLDDRAVRGEDILPGADAPQEVQQALRDCRDGWLEGFSGSDIERQALRGFFDRIIDRRDPERAGVTHEQLRAFLSPEGIEAYRNSLSGGANEFRDAQARLRSLSTGVSAQTDHLRLLSLYVSYRGAGMEPDSAAQRSLRENAFECRQWIDSGSSAREAIGRVFSLEPEARDFLEWFDGSEPFSDRAFSWAESLRRRNDPSGAAGVYRFLAQQGGTTGARAEEALREFDGNEWIRGRVTGFNDPGQILLSMATLGGSAALGAIVERDIVLFLEPYLASPLIRGAAGTVARVETESRVMPLFQQVEQAIRSGEWRELSSAEYSNSVDETRRTLALFRGIGMGMGGIGNILTWNPDLRLPGAASSEGLAALQPSVRLAFQAANFASQTGGFVFANQLNQPTLADQSPALQALMGALDLGHMALSAGLANRAGGGRIHEFESETLERLQRPGTPGLGNPFRDLSESMNEYFTDPISGNQRQAMAATIVACAAASLILPETEWPVLPLLAMGNAEQPPPHKLAIDNLIRRFLEPNTPEITLDHIPEEIGLWNRQIAALRRTLTDSDQIYLIQTLTQEALASRTIRNDHRFSMPQLASLVSPENFPHLMHFPEALLVARSRNSPLRGIALAFLDVIIERAARQNAREVLYHAVTLLSENTTHLKSRPAFLSQFHWDENPSVILNLAIRIAEGLGSPDPGTRVLRDRLLSTLERHLGRLHPEIAPFFRNLGQGQRPNLLAEFSEWLIDRSGESLAASDGLLAVAQLLQGQPRSLSRVLHHLSGRLENSSSEFQGSFDRAFRLIVSHADFTGEPDAHTESALSDMLNMIQNINDVDERVECLAILTERIDWKHMSWEAGSNGRSILNAIELDIDAILRPRPVTLRPYSLYRALESDRMPQELRKRVYHLAKLLEK